MTGPFRIEFRDLSHNRLADPPVKGRALVTILKNDSEAGSVTWSGVHYEGDRVGRPKGSDSFRHRVFSRRLGKECDVDFNTGIRIDEINPAQVVGGTSFEGFQTIVVDQVVFTKPNGVWEWLHLMEGPDIKVDEAKALDLVKATRYKADEVLYRADQDWKSRNPRIRRRAQESYRLLLNKCSEDAIVRSNVDRIKSRSEADIED